MSLSKHIKVIEDINSILRTSELSGNIGLHAGTSGIGLFLAYYDRIIQQKTEVSQRVVDILDHNIKQINLESRQHTIGLFMLSHLCSNETSWDECLMLSLGKQQKSNILFIINKLLFYQNGKEKFKKMGD